MRRYLLTIVAVISVYSLMSQNKMTVEKYWLSSGYGFNTLPGYAIYISANVKADKHLLTLRYISNTEKLRSSTVILDQMINCSEVGLLYGRSWHTSFGFASVSAGISGTSGIKRRYLLYRDLYNFWPLVYEVYDYKRYFTAGFSLEAGAVFSPIDWVSIGILGYANLNMREPLVGVAFIGTLGKVRE